MPGDEDKSNDKAAAPVQFQFAQKPEELPGWEGFKKFLWNSETSEFMGRTGCSWFKIGLFYIVYYLFLTGYFLAMLVIFYQTLDEHEPKWKGANGIIGDNPGLGFRPSPDPDSVETTLVKFRHGDYNGNWHGWAQRLDEYLAAYKAASNKVKPNPNIVQCDYDRPAGEGQFCQVDAAGLMASKCTNETNYGYREGTPCMLIKLNKIYDWLPELYKNSSEFPDKMPNHLKEYVKAKEAEGHKMASGKMVWMSCEGENPADRENIGEIEYFPQPGFPSYYFPYKNQEGYLSPAVFAYLKNPKQGVLISISCKGWAKNIKHDTMERLGSVHFELMID